MSEKKVERLTGNDVPAARAPFTVLSVERCIAELRRGRPIVIHGAGGNAVLALAAEALSPLRLEFVREAAGTVPELAITSRRASVLGLSETAGKIAIIGGLSDATSDDISGLANPLLGASQLGSVQQGTLDRETLSVSTASGHDCASAAVALAKHARLLPAAVIATLDVPDDITVWAHRHDFLHVDTGDVFQYVRAASRNLRKVAEAPVPITDAEDTRIVAFRPEDGGREHLAIVVGSPAPDEPVLIRLHSECFTGDLIGSLRCDCGDQLQGAMGEIKAAGKGILLYLAQEGRGIGLVNKLRAYELQDAGFDTLDANEQLGFDADERVYLPAARMLRLLGHTKVRLMTNNPDKVEALRINGIDVVERVEHAFPSNRHNEFYLQTKANRAGHHL